MPSTSRELESNDGVNGQSLLTQESDPSFYVDLPDLDVFGLFDPNFNLDGIDAYLEGNLNLTCPTNF